jgi:hypothetical protein
MRNPKVDPALRERRAILELLQRVDKPEITYAELESIAEELVGAGSQAAPVLLQEIANTEDLDRLNKLTFLAAYLDDERIVEPLSRLLFHPNRSRAYKAQILQALERLGVDVNSGFYQSVVRRREALRLNLVELRRRLAVRPEAAIQFLYDVFYATADQRMATARLLLEERDAASLELAGLLAEISEDAVWKFVVEHLAHARSAEAATVLAGMAHFAVPPRLVSEAGRGIRRLQFSGHALPTMPVAAPEHAVAWAGRVEGNGTQMLWIASRREGDTADTVCFLLHESRGLIDCFGEVRGSLSQFVQTSVQEGDDDGGRAVSLAYARQQIEHALFLSQGQGLPLPPEYPFRIRCLKLTPLHPRQAKAVEPVARPAAPEWKALCELFDEPVMDDWLINDPGFFQLVALFFERGKFDKPEMERLIRRVYEEFVQPEVPMLRQRILHNGAWVAEWGGGESLVERLRTAAATLDEPAPEKNALVQHFILRSVREAHDMLREGYDPSVIYDDEP